MTFCFLFDSISLKRNACRRRRRLLSILILRCKRAHFFFHSSSFSFSLSATSFRFTECCYLAERERVPCASYRTFKSISFTFFFIISSTSISFVQKMKSETKECQRRVTSDQFEIFPFLFCFRFSFGPPSALCATSKTLWRIERISPWQFRLQMKKYWKIFSAFLMLPNEKCTVFPSQFSTCEVIADFTASKRNEEKEGAENEVQMSRRPCQMEFLFYFSLTFFVVSLSNEFNFAVHFPPLIWFAFRKTHLCSLAQQQHRPL